MPKFQDTDFLYLSAMVRELENHLISTDQLDRMIRAETDADALKVLEECGYGLVEADNPIMLDRALSQKATAILKELAARGPDPAIVDVFRVKYDYHNAKVLIKAEFADVDGDRLMSDGGRVSRAIFEDRYYDGLPAGVPLALGNATLAARTLVAQSGDAQAADILLDRAMYQEYLDLAKAMEDAYFGGYIRLSIDGINLRTAVRAVRMGMTPEALIDALIPGGNISPARVVAGSGLQSLYVGTALEKAARLAPAAMTGGDLTAFEREVDNALLRYVGMGSYKAFGIAPVLAYLSSLEAEAMSVRIVMASRSAGLTPEQIRERLRG
ncbi:MAG: V-type ATPase subunit [Oscillospiraceae bacterium]|nr:V-type ATPase subunit [Oscillospiraceae bacterium]